MKTNKNSNMKKLIFLIVLALGLVTQLQAQNIATDMVVLDNSCPNFVQLQALYQGQPNLFVLAVGTVMPLNQIATALAGKNVTDLHIFLWAKPGSLVFSNLAVTPENVDEYATPLGTWASHVSGKVIIHDSDVFASQEGPALKAKLEQLTGLTFIAQ
jgi:hypothetical protein